MSNDTLPQLSEREREILRLVATGATNQQIAAQLNISANTVKVHLRNIFGKIGVASRTEATVYAVRNGLLDVDSTEREIDSSVTLARIPPQDQSSEDEAAMPPQALQSDTSSGLAHSRSTVVRRPQHLLLMFGGALGVIVLVASIVTLVIRNNLTAPTSAIQSSGIGPSPTEPRWKALTPLPSPRAGFALVAYNYEGRQYLYAIGGETTNGVSSDMIRFDLQTNTWVQLSNKPTAVTDVQAVVVGDRLYVPGGRLASGAISDSLEAYEPRRDRWITLASLPGPRSGYALAVVEGKIYLFGGWDGRLYRADVWQYNPDTNTWTERRSLIEPRAFAAAATVEERIYIIGGESENGPVTFNETYKASDDTPQGAPWSTRLPLPEARSHLAAVAAGGRIFAVGGGGTEGSALLYNVNLDAWEPLRLPIDAHLKDARMQVVDNKVYIAGGRTQDGFVEHLYEYQAFYTVFLPLVPNN
ncbi:MAG: kelch repeat-containing protein [Roseiflexaceae bacterium]|nr:LuxR C-terminal-related transcriptional regulator [Roseiflexus sp.]MDW8233957.1 kelch repeat-containing protein [Roseiflexaceae bacterium]